MIARRNFLSFLVTLVLVCPVSMVMAQEAARSLNDDLMYRITFGRPEDVHDLLEKGAQPNIYGDMGDTPLTLGIKRKTNDAVDIVKFLLLKGADPNFPDKNGVYPLEIAIKDGRPALVKTLIEGGADIHLKNIKGVTMSELATSASNAEVADLINRRLRKEAELDAEMRKPERLLALMQQFSSKVCEYTYWSNFLASGQIPQNTDLTREKIAKAKPLAEQLGNEIARYFPTIALDSFIKYSSESITNQFTALRDNKTRAENGIGTDDDMRKRCGTIAEATRASIQAVLAAQKKAQDDAAAAQGQR